jgi:nicotinamide riboside transporter PnuC
MIHLIDIFGALCGIFGAIFVGQLKSKGYVLFMLCNISYFTLGLMQGFYGLVVVSVVMFVIDVIYFIKWKKEGR